MENVLVNIDSRFRDRLKYPNAAKCTYRMSEKIKNCKYIRMSSIEFPNLYHTFSSKKLNTYFYITCTDTINDISGSFVINTPFKITISNGMYDTESMLLEIQAQLDKINVTGSYEYKVIFNNLNGHVRLTSIRPFSVNFYNGYNPQDNMSLLYPSLGHHLGYRDISYNAIPNPDIDMDDPDHCGCDENNEYYIVNSNCNMDVAGDTYIFLKVNDYGNIYHDFEEISVNVYNNMSTLDSAIVKKKRQGDKDLLAKIILTSNKGSQVFDNGANYLTKSYTFRQQADIDHFDIELIDPRGYTVNMCCVDFSMTLEIGIIYDSSLYKNNNDNVYDNLISGLPNLPVINKLENFENIVIENKKEDEINSIFEDNTMPVIDVSNMEKPKSKSKRKYKFKY